MAAVSQGMEKLIEEINEWCIPRLEELDSLHFDNRRFDATTNYRLLY
jgi:hypothetical protein